MTRNRPLIGAVSGMLMLGLAVSAAAQTAVVARISSIEGQVLVNQGHGFRPAQVGMALHAGDRVISPRDGQALVTYAAGCATPLEAGSITTIDQSQACQPRLIKARMQASGAGVGPAATAAGAGGFGEWLTEPVVIGGVSISKGLAALLLLGGGVGTAAAAGAFNPASP